MFNVFSFRVGWEQYSNCSILNHRQPDSKLWNCSAFSFLDQHTKESKFSTLKINDDHFLKAILSVIFHFILKALQYPFHKEVIEYNILQCIWLAMNFHKKPILDQRSNILFIADSGDYYKFWCEYCWNMVLEISLSWILSTRSFLV